VPNTRFFIPGSSWSGVHTSTGPEAPYDARDSGYHRRAPLSRQVGLEPIGSYDELVAHAETVSIGGRPTQVIGLDDLIPIKRHINRPKDRESLLQLDAIKRLRDQEGPR
jgi:hypothetical protein